MILLKRFLGTLLVALFLVPVGQSQSLQTVVPESVGMSSERLDRLVQVLDAYVDNELLAGSVTLILKDGHVVHERAAGMRDIEAADPMETDDLFRIASQTKAIVSTAVLIMQEHGRLNIEEPIGKYLPEWMETTVAVASEDGYDVVPATRPIRIRDLLTHTAGVGWGTGPAQPEWEEADMMFWYLADRPEGIREIARQIAALPMDAQPGERFVYGLSIDVLGALVEEVSGQPLDAFLEEHLFQPLGMVDTHFFVPPEKADRMAVVYGSTESGLVRQTAADGHYHGQGHYLDGPRATFGGGAGLVSTARDYARFLQMVLNGGHLGGARILSPTTVELMLSNHIGDIDLGAGYKMGLGFGIITDLGAWGRAGSEGEFGWGGAYHSTYFVSPKHDMVVVYMSQAMISRPGVDDHNKIRSMSYQAIIH